MKIHANILNPDMALENLHGRVAWLFDQIDFDVDQIVGVKNIKIKDPDELARLAMANYEADFASRIRPGDLLVGTKAVLLSKCPQQPPHQALGRSFP